VRAWCRLLLVTRLLEEPGRTVESIALQLDYPSASALRNQVRRFLGMTLSEAAAQGGFAFALERFARAMGRRAPPRRARFAFGEECADRPAADHHPPAQRDAHAAMPVGVGAGPSPHAEPGVLRRVAELPSRVT
jgi:hypothetical protein